MSPCKWKRIQSRNCKRKEEAEAGRGREEDSRPEQSLVEQTNQNVRTPAIFGKRLTARGTEQERGGGEVGKRGEERQSETERLVASEMALRNCLTLGTGASSHRRQQPSPHPLCRPLSRCVRGRESCRIRRKLQLRGRRRCRRNRSSDSNSSSKESLRLPSSKAALAITPGTRLEDWNVAIVPSEQFVCVRLTSAAAEA